MNNVISHRGPDDGGVFYEQVAGEGMAIGLAHRRLSILDLSSSGHQPMWNDRGDVAIIYNGEIYNFLELRRELEGNGGRFKSDTDTEVVLALYCAYGTEMLERLDGIFAFAIWDKRNQSLFVARDQFGIKPLYWCQSQQGFIFASELKAINQWQCLDRTLDSEALQHYLTYMYCPAPRTPFLHVRKLEPGMAMLVQAGKVLRNWRHYRLPYDLPIVPMSAAEAKERLRETLANAVRKQMIADVPVGAFLSGGLDSSAIAAFARDQAAGRLQCFTIELNRRDTRAEGFADDLPYARKMAEHLDVDLHVISVDANAVDHFDKMVWHLDEPQGDPAPINVYFISQLARENGIKVLLSGAGGDDIFSGYRRHSAQALEHYWSWLPLGMRRAIAAGSAALPARSGLGRRLRKAFSAMPYDGNSRVAHYYDWIAPQTAASLVGRVYEPARDPLIQALDDIPADTQPLNKMLYLESRFFLSDHNLNYTDKMAMAAGVEVRVPFLDRELVQFAAQLPVDLKLHRGTGKWIFREAMRGILPDALIDRPKTGFGAPVRRWLQHDLRGMVDNLTAPNSGLAGIVDLKTLKDLVARDRAGQIDAAYTILGALALESWLRQFAQPLPESSGRGGIRCA